MPYGSTTWTRVFTSDPIDVGTYVAPQLACDFYIDENNTDSAYIAYKYNSTNPANDTFGRLFFSHTAHPLSGSPTWSNITPSVVTTNNINSIAVDPHNASRIWIAFGNINNAYVGASPDTMKNRVWYSNNAGTTWTDVSTGLSALPVNKLLYRKGSADELYAGTDVGVFKWNDTTASWQCFNNGLPTCIVMDMEFNYCAGKLRVATYGRGIWETPLGDLPPVSDTFNTVITTNTTWSQNMYLENSIFVNSGGTLNITGDTVHMPKNGAIYVEPGGKLTVSNAVITNDCSQCFWQGISAIGTYDAPQTLGNSGWVVINNSTIQHAVTGVSDYNATLGVVTGYATTGGVIQATGSYFTDNQTDVSLANYVSGSWSAGPVQRDRSYFDNCTFLLDNNYKGDALGIHMNNEVSLNSVYGVQFEGCQFLNRDTATFSRAQGEGIRASDASFYVQPYCTTISPFCASPARSRFCGFINGIDVEHESAADFTISIDQADFDTVSEGVFVSAYNNVSVTRCSFKVGHGLGINQVPGSSFAGCNQNVGIFNQNCSLFEIENNTFSGVTSPPYDWYNYGVIVVNDWLAATAVSYATPPTLAMANKVYLNTFDTLTEAVCSIGDNRGDVSEPLGGLEIACNTFSTNANDIFITPNSASDTLASIAFAQGSLSMPAANTFSNSGYNIVDNGRAIDYYYNPSVTGEQPTSFSPSSGKVLLIHTTGANTCPTSFPAIGSPVQLGMATLRPVMRDLSTHRNASQTALNSYNGSIDGGSTASLISIIDASGNPSTLYSRLSAYSPFLSEAAFKEMGSRLAITYPDILNLLVANPDVLRDLDFVNAMYGYYPALTSNSGTLATDATTITTRTTLENNIDSNQRAAGTDANAVMMALKSPMDTNISPTDTTGAGICTDSTSMYYRLDSNSYYFGVDSIDTWLKNIGGQWTWYARIGFYNATQQYGLANNLLSSIKADTAVAAYDTVTFDSFYHYYNELYTAESAYPYAGVFPLTGTQMAAVSYSLNMADTISFTNNYAVTVVANLARLVLPTYPIPFADPCFIHVEQLPRYGHTDTTASPPAVGSINGENTGSRFTAYPNPASGIVTFTYNVPNDPGSISIEITNMLGAAITTIVTGNNQGKVNWNTQSQPPGVYLYRAGNDQGIIAQGKLILIR